MDGQGEPLPWYTYPAIQFLLLKDFSQRRVLEWGAGQSTLFWAKRAREVIAFEADKQWCDYLMNHLPPNAAIHQVNRDLAHSPLGEDETFDVIVVDGLDRWKCAKWSVSLLADEGVIIVDDAERSVGPEPGCRIADLYRETGFSRMDFYGYSPGNTTQHCTSIFFRESCFLNRGDENPEITLSFW